MAITPVTTHDLKALGGFAYVTPPATRIATAINALITAVETPSDYKQSVRVATAAALAAYTRTVNTIQANANGALAAIDGIACAVGNRVLLKNGAADQDNGIYTIVSLGAAGSKWSMIRSDDANTSALVTSGMLVPVEEGTANAATIFELTTANPIVLNTDALSFVGAKLATAPRVDSMIPTPALLAGFDMAASGVLKLAANCIISRVTVYPLSPWTVGAGETSAWALVNATTGKSLATKTFADAPPASGTPVDFTLNATSADLICSAGDVLTLAVTNSAAAAVAAAHLQIVGA